MRDKVELEEFWSMTARGFTLQPLFGSHVFAKWLRDKGWKGRYGIAEDRTGYYLNTGELLAFALTDNKACTCTVYTRDATDVI